MASAPEGILAEHMASTPAAPSPPRSRLDVVREVAIDGAFLSGAGLVSYGVWQLSHAAAFIVAGVMLIAAGINGARR